MAKPKPEDALVEGIAELIEYTREKPLPPIEPWQFHKPGGVVVCGPSGPTEFNYSEAVAALPRWFVTALGLTGNKLRDYGRKGPAAGSIWRFLADAKKSAGTRGLPVNAVLWLRDFLEEQIAAVREEDRIAVEKVKAEKVKPPRGVRKPNIAKARELLRAQLERVENL